MYLIRHYKALAVYSHDRMADWVLGPPGAACHHERVLYRKSPAREQNQTRQPSLVTLHTYTHFWHEKHLFNSTYSFSDYVIQIHLCLSLFGLSGRTPCCDHSLGRVREIPFWGVEDGKVREGGGSYDSPTDLRICRNSKTVQEVFRIIAYILIRIPKDNNSLYHLILKENAQIDSLG